MPTSDYRSSITTQGRRMAGARALWRATGMKTEDFLKPVVAIANSFTQFVPGHVHLPPSASASSKSSTPPAATASSSTPSPWTTASPWATTACSTPCPAWS